MITWLLDSELLNLFLICMFIQHNLKIYKHFKCDQNVTGDDDYSSGSSGSLDQNLVKPDDVYNAGM